MKKPENYTSGEHYFYPKRILLIMKLTTLLLTLNFLQIAANGFSQGDKLTLSLKDATMKEMFTAIEGMTNYKFLYRDDELENAEISIEANQLPLSDLLAEALGNTNSTYVMLENNLIVIVPVDKSQPQTVKGTVTDAKTGEALIGVNIMIEGTQQGVISDAGGNFTINVPDGNAVIIVSYIGYVSQKFPAAGLTTLDVKLEPDVEELEEIIVIGYGTQKRNEVTSAVANVRSDQFNKGNVNSPVQLIQGKVAGLSISKPGSDPNGTYDIRLRGLSTIGTNTSPLVVIDGISGGELSNVDPNDIESISVLKDASGAAIYGSRAASGVILVTTKKGRSGVANIEYNGYVTMETVAKNTDVMSASEWRSFSDKVGAGTDFGSNTDWFKEIEQTAVSHVHNISLTGGTEKSSYRAAINYRDANGILVHTGSNQLNGRLSFTQRAINDRLTIDLNLGATERKSNPGFNEAFRYATVYNPTSPIMSDDPSHEKFNGYFQQEGSFDYYNPVSIVEQNKRENRNRYLNLSLKGTIQVTKGFAVDAFYAFQSNNELKGEYFNKGDYWGGYSRNGLGARDQDASNTKLFETTAHWNGNLASALNVNILGGYSYQEFHNEGFYAQGGDFLTNKFSFNNLAAALDFKNGLGTITSYQNSSKLIAFFGRLNLNYDDTYYLTGSARYEGSSKFGKNNKWGLFPAVSLGVDISKFINASVIDNLKLRINYGVTGNQPTDNYLSLQRIGPVLENDTQKNFYYNGSYSPAYGIVSNANPDLKWERQGEFDAGFDFSFLGSLIYGSFDYYTRTTTDLLFDFEVPQPPNLFNKAWVNIGEIKSSGIELTLNINVIKQSDLNYTVSLTPSYNLNNELVSLSGTFNGAKLTYGVKDLGNMGSPGQNQTPLIRVEEGKPIGQLLGYEFQEVDATGNLIMVDQPNTSTGVDQADRIIIGNALPKFLMGFGNTINYKNWDVNVFFRGVFGHDLLNSFRGFYEVPALISTYNLPKSSEDMKNANGTYMKNTTNLLSDHHVENASFVSLDNMSIGYTVKAGTLGKINRVRLYVAGNNLFYITKYKGVDPNPRYKDSDPTAGTFNSSLVPGIDRRDTWFRTRSFTLGANVVF